MKRLHSLGIVGVFLVFPLVLSAQEREETRSEKRTAAVREAAAAPGAAVERAPSDPVYAPPRLLNGDEVVEAMDSLYPPDLRARRIAGAPVLELRIGATGEVERATLSDAGGHRLFGAAALEVAEVMRFAPAVVSSAERRITVSLPVRFQVELPPSLQDLPLAEAPPSVTNRREVAELLRRHYPDYLRGTGIEGEVLLEVVVDAEGRVWNVELAEASGELALDEIGLALGSYLEFEPTLDAGEPVPALARVPLRFDAW